MATQKKQLMLIHGGMTFKNEKDYFRYLKTRTVSLERFDLWTGEYLDKKLGKDFAIIRPRMPRSENAVYEEWKIHFERYIPLLKDNCTLVGFSLGGIFLAKYLSEHHFPKKIRAVFLVAAPFDDTLSEDLVNGFVLKKNLTRLESQTKHLFLLFSEDDPIVHISHARKYKEKLPKATLLTFTKKGGHFIVPTFPEIAKLIRDPRDA